MGGEGEGEGAEGRWLGCGQRGVGGGLRVCGMEGGADEGLGFRAWDLLSWVQCTCMACRCCVWALGVVAQAWRPQCVTCILEGENVRVYMCIYEEGEHVAYVHTRIYLYTHV